MAHIDKFTAAWLRHLSGLLATLAAMAVFYASGCGAGYSEPPKPSVTLSPSSAQTVDQGKTVSITATVANDTGSKGVTWALTGAGALSAQTATTVTYTAPASVTSASTATVTATSVADTTKTAILSINLVVPPTINVTAFAAGNVGTAYSSTALSATGGVAPYTWAVTSAAGTFPTGLTLGTNGTISGIPTAQGTFNFTVVATDSQSVASVAANLSIVIGPALPLSVTTTTLAGGNVSTAYTATLAATGGVAPYTWTVTTAPSTFPTGLVLSSAGVISGTPTTAATYNFTVQVKDSANTTATANLSIVISAAIANACGPVLGNETVLNGKYAFLVQGFTGTGTLNPATIAASFAADGAGNVTAGDLDFNNASGHQHVTINATGSFFNVGSDNRGCVTVATSGSTYTFRFGLGGINAGVASKGHIIEFDDATGNGTRASGILRLQTAGAFNLTALQPRYAFGLDGFDLAGGHVAVGGAFNLNTSTGAISNALADVNDGGVLQAGLTAGTGTLGAASVSDGRLTGTINNGVTATFNFVAYVVNANELFLATTDTLGASTPIVSGRAIVTDSAFTASSLSGNDIIHVSGSSSGTASATIGLLTFSSGAVSGKLFQWDGTTASTNPISGGTYAIGATTGRVTLTGTGNHPPVIYLTSATKANDDSVSGFIVGTDTSAIFGLAETQPAVTYSNSSLTGNFFFGVEDPNSQNRTMEAGTGTAASGTFTGFSDRSHSSTPFLQTQVSLGSITLNIGADGTGDVGANTVAVTNGTKLLIIDEGAGSGAKITVVEQ